MATAVQEQVREFVIVPLDDRIVVQQEAEQAEEVTKGGIVIPDNVKEKPLRGQVIAVGTGKVFESGEVRPLTVKVGDWVVFGRYAGVELPAKEYGPNLLMMREDEVLGVLRFED